MRRKPNTPEPPATIDPARRERDRRATADAMMASLRARLEAPGDRLVRRARMLSQYIDSLATDAASGDAEARANADEIISRLHETLARADLHWRAFHLALCVESHATNAPDAGTIERFLYVVGLELPDQAKRLRAADREIIATALRGWGPTRKGKPSQYGSFEALAVAAGLRKPHAGFPQDLSRWRARFKP